MSQPYSRPLTLLTRDDRLLCEQTYNKYKHGMITTVEANNLLRDHDKSWITKNGFLEGSMAPHVQYYEALKRRDELSAMKRRPGLPLTDTPSKVSPGVPVVKNSTGAVRSFEEQLVVRRAAALKKQKAAYPPCDEPDHLRPGTASPFEHPALKKSHPVPVGELAEAEKSIEKEMHVKEKTLTKATAISRLEALKGTDPAIQFRSIAQEKFLSKFHEHLLKNPDVDMKAVEADVKAELEAEFRCEEKKKKGIEKMNLCENGAEKTPAKPSNKIVGKLPVKTIERITKHLLEKHNIEPPKVEKNLRQIPQDAWEVIDLDDADWDFCREVVGYRKI